MCFPVAALGLSAAQTLMLGVSVAGAAASYVSADQNAKKQQDVLRKQSAVQQDEISRAAGQQLTEQARAARRERATLRANASEAGVNLNSGSFLAALQTSALNQSNNMGLITQNETAQQRARSAETSSLLNQSARPNALVGVLGIAGAGVGTYNDVTAAAQRGSNAAVGT